MLEDYTGLEKLANSLPENHPLLSVSCTPSLQPSPQKWQSPQMYSLYLSVDMGCPDYIIVLRTGVCEKQ